MNPDEIAGVAEVADRLGVTRRTVYTYSRREDFPRPVDRLATGPVWRITDVERWAKATLPLRRGRPPQLP